MDSEDRWLIPLGAAADYPEDVVGGKAAKLARLQRAGFAVPAGFCVMSRA